MIKEWLVRQAHYHRADMSGVEPEHRTVAGVIYLNSPAGHLTFKARSAAELCAFRDQFLNPFSLLAARHGRGEDVALEFFALYRKIRKKSRAKWKANLHTRARAALHASGIR